MGDPYEVLGLGSSATPAEIRDRYLKLVRAHPPERDPEKFAAIHEAYDQLRDPVVSLENRLFSLTWSETLEDLLAEEERRVSERPVPTDVLLSLGES